MPDAARNSPRAFTPRQSRVRPGATLVLRAWRKAGRRPILSTAIVILCSFCSILLITEFAGIQAPTVHDELAQLVQADIFAHGRLAERPHPFWQHFETMHVLSQPTYQAKFPPAAALFMAAGEKLTGVPSVGVWMSVLLMIAAVGYALHALLPGHWAFVGTALAALQFGVVSDWSHGYWGGAVAAAGGALVLGAAVRLLRVPTVRDATFLGGGFVLLLLSRPYEGLAYSVPLVAVLGWHACRPSSIRTALWRTAIPMAVAVSALGCGWLGYYNWRVTGSALTLPYVVYQRTYSAAPLFVWQKPLEPAPVFRHREIEKFELQFSMPSALLDQRGWPLRQLRDLDLSMFDYLKLPLSLAFLGVFAAPRAMRTSSVIAAASWASMLAAMMLACWVAPRYLAPATAAIFALITVGLAGFWRLTIRRVRGRPVAIAIVLVVIGTTAAMSVQYIDRTRASVGWWTAKRDIGQRLLQLPGNDLVFVRYKPSHNPHFEWVYNGSDIDQQPIVWAREMDPAADERLRKYFADRQTWVVLADEIPSRLVKWPDGGVLSVTADPGAPDGMPSTH